MKKTISRHLNKILTAFLILLIGLFAFSLFKNIQYPLLWNDEAATVMFAKSILKYGYPRVIFEGNFLTQLPKLGLKDLENPDTSAVIETGWLDSYVETPFVAIGEATNNIYLKTALVRIPSAVLGLAGIIIFGYIATLFINKKVYKTSAFILFLFIALYNIPLTLHLREARYYSLLLFLLSIYCLILIRFVILSNLRYKYFALCMPVISLAVLLTYPPAFVPCLALLYVAPVIYRGNLHLSSINSAAPAIVATILSIPILRFFNVFTLSRLTAKYYHLNFPTILSHIYQIIFYLYNDELLISAILILAILFILNSKQKNKLLLYSYFQFLFFAAIFSIFYIAVLSRLPYLFTRYYIYIGPLITIITVVGLILSLNILNRKIIFIFLACIFISNFVIHNGNEKAGRFTGHIYEITHRYEGPIDVIIPYILSHTNQPEKLTIATNYEEFSYMYYLRSRITIGYIGINLQEDLKIQPDIIIFRPGWGSNPKYFIDFLKKKKYYEITFPIQNYPLNNIPEFYFTFPHQFKTLYAQNEDEKLAIFVAAEQNK